MCKQVQVFKNLILLDRFLKINIVINKRLLKRKIIFKKITKHCFYEKILAKIMLSFISIN